MLFVFLERTYLNSQYFQILAYSVMGITKTFGFSFKINEVADVLKH
jgi:hypothetical protein